MFPRPRKCNATAANIFQRDATQREKLSETIRSIRADTLRQTSDFERLQIKHAEAQRKLGIADAAERALKLQLKSAEAAARGLKEEMGKMKVLVNQTRAQCANEVRKRERTIEGMKKHVGEGGRARGTGKTVGVTSINVVAGVGAETNAMSTASTNEPGYDLRMETNEFLTELARGLSEENENMGGLLRRTVETLRSLSGCEKDDAQEGRMVIQTESGYEDLAAEMDFVIDHLRNLLTNPSFVPLEEVEVREEEIIRLREGWERMEARWREAVQMMDGWRKRMARSGQTVNIEELKMGIRLSPLKSTRKVGENEERFQLSTLMEEGEGDTQADIDAMEEEEEFEVPAEPEFDDLESDSESSLFQEEPLEEESEPISDEQEEDFSLKTASSPAPGPPPQLSPLRETSGNRGVNEGFSTIVEENTYELLQLNTSSRQKPRPTPKSTPRRQRDENHNEISPADEVSLLKTSDTSQRSPKKPSKPTPRAVATPRLRDTPSSRLPRPREQALPQQSPLTMATIAAKLAATEREADAARVRAKIKAARMKNSNAANVDAVKLMPPPPKQGEGLEPSKDNREAPDPDQGARKRKAQGRQGGRANRRRSTLSPWELESLMLGGVGES